MRHPIDLFPYDDDDKTVASQNTDREIWRKRPGDFYSPSMHATQSGGIGINCGGHVIVAPVERWHDCGEKLLCVDPTLPRWRWNLAMRLLRWSNTEISGRAANGESKP